MLLAHSRNEKKGIPPQSYAAHVGGVFNKSMMAASSAANYSALNGTLLKDVVGRSAEYHDLGKLDPSNQEVLSGKRKASSLPILHTDAGTAYLLAQNGTPFDAALVYSHHIGLPDFSEEGNKGESLLFRTEKVASYVDASLKKLIQYHLSSLKKGLAKAPVCDKLQSEYPSVVFRIALSCLVDGDHTDTATHYKQYPSQDSPIGLRPSERLSALDKYVAKLGGESDPRSNLRREMYEECKNSEANTSIVSCDSPVGSGKTTAVMANLLRQAEKRGLRRIFVVLPFTNIITQSAEVYRNALCLPGEKPEEVVAELHHRADFQNWESRYLTALWKAPVIVTTAVAFFETLASNTTATLRKLHNLPGSAIFVDEAHAALPAKLLPVAWKWMKAMAHEWSCYWVLASGSLNKFWKIREFESEHMEIPEIVTDALRDKLNHYEKNRIIYRYKPNRLNASDMVAWVNQLPGPRILILNTVQSAAFIARAFNRAVGRNNVEHLSTALTPLDRSKTLERVKNRLGDSTDTDWVLVATSCVEAGVDISFRTGIREQGSLVSLLQTAGRVNRHGELDGAEVWTFRLCEGAQLKTHQGLKDAVKVLGELFEQESEISPKLCTRALEREIRYGGTDLATIQQCEAQMRFPLVEKMFKVIEGDTRPVIVDDHLIQKIENYEQVDWRDIQNCSVQVWGYKLEDLRVPEFSQKPGLYRWSLKYDSFIGYMAGILDCFGEEGLLTI